MLSLASFMVALIGVLVAIASFMVGGSRAHPLVRVVICVPALLIAIVFGLIGIFSFIGRETNSLPGPPAQAPPTTPIWPPATQHPQEPAKPLRQHNQTSIGTGVFRQVTYSDGQEPLTEVWLQESGHIDIQRMRREEYPDGCAISSYDVKLVWVAAGERAQVTVSGSTVGEITYITEKQRHGYVAPLSLREGDRICVVPIPASGFHFIFGPDVYYHYDSYCYRGHC